MALGRRQQHGDRAADRGDRVERGLDPRCAGFVGPDRRFPRGLVYRWVISDHGADLSHATAAVESTQAGSTVGQKRDGCFE